MAMIIGSGVWRQCGKVLADKGSRHVDSKACWGMHSWLAKAVHNLHLGSGSVCAGVRGGCGGRGRGEPRRGRVEGIPELPRLRCVPAGAPSPSVPTSSPSWLPHTYASAPLLSAHTACKPCTLHILLFMLRVPMQPSYALVVHTACTYSHPQQACRSQWMRRCHAHMLLLAETAAKLSMRVDRY